MLDTHQLNVFLTAAETLNFTQAAGRLHMTQPSVSQHIHSLENHFGQLLFVRNGRSIHLTSAGVALLPLARDIIHRSVHIEEMMQSLEGIIHGDLYVGCSTTPGKYLLPPLLARFHRHHPQVQVACHVSSQRNALQRVCDGDAHLALVSKAEIVPRDIELKQLAVDEVKLIAPLDHPWAERGVIEAADLYETDFILREEGSGTRTAVEESLYAIGIEADRLNTLLILGNSEAIAMAVEEGLGVGFVSGLIVTRLVRDRVAPITVRGLNITRDIYVGRHSRRPATAAQTAFWDFIDEAVPQ